MQAPGQRLRPAALTPAGAPFRGKGLERLGGGLELGAEGRRRAAQRGHLERAHQ